ncbi:UNVERIFIED_CONTAM: putative membrane protein [Williamsia faeni]
MATDGDLGGSAVPAEHHVPEQDTNPDHNHPTDALNLFDSPEVYAADRREVTTRDLPSRTDPVVAPGSFVIGGPIGLHAVVGRGRTWTPVRVLMLIALVFLALGWYTKAGCLQQAPNAETGVMGLDWDNHRQYTAMCYADTIPLYGAERLDEGAFPYKKSWYEDDGAGGQQQRFMEYPVLTGVFMYAAAQSAQGWEWAHENWGVPGALDVVLFFNLVALGLALCWLVTIWATALTAQRRVWAAALAAASPLVVVHIFTNFDAIAIAALSVAMLAWSRRNPWLTGIFLGIGMSAKLYPALLLIPLLVLCLRAGKVRDFGVTAALTAATWLVINLPIMITHYRGWTEFFRYNSDRGTDPDTLFNVISEITGYQWGNEPGQAPALLNAISMGLFVLVALAVVFIGFHAPMRPRLAQLMFLTVAGFLLVNKVWSPQYSLWLVPLAVLALPHTRILLGWMLIDALVWVPRMMWYLFKETGDGLPEQWFLSMVVIRDLAVIGLCVMVIWQIYHPVEDLVRRGRGWRAIVVDDPGGGVLDNAPDRMPWPCKATKTPVRETDPPTEAFEAVVRV